MMQVPIDLESRRAVFDRLPDADDPERDQRPVGPPPDPDVLRRIREVHRRICAAEAEMLELVGRLDPEQGWEHEGADSAAHWLAMTLGTSTWKAHRFVAAAGVLPHLPTTAAAHAMGDVSTDKVIELARFARPATEAHLLAWAERSTPATIRHRADRERAAAADAAEAHGAREVRAWQLGVNLGSMQAILPTADLQVVLAGLDRTAATLPTMPGEDPHPTAATRRADALVAICSARLASDPDPDRATLIVHATVGSHDGPTIEASDGSAVAGSPRPDATTARLATAEVELSSPLPARVVSRLACDARIQTVWEDPHGRVLSVSPMRREPSTAILRQLRWRDRGCRFPGCGRRAFTQAHHIRFWSRGGATTLDNLVLVCFLHHRLVHEYGWILRIEPDGELVWIRPDGVCYRAGPAP